MIVRVLVLLLIGTSVAHGQQKSVARIWNEVLLEAIRNDYARPTVHARNLFHISAAMYDAWSAFEESCTPYFLGNSVHGFMIPFDGISFDPSEKDKLQKEALSYAAYNLIKHRFAESPGVDDTFIIIENLMDSLGYDSGLRNEDYSNGSASALGIYLANQIKLYGYQDGANERGNYESLYYEPVNDALDLSLTGVSNHLKNPNRWQPLKFDTFIDQSGNEIAGGEIDFLSPEWGNVDVFAIPMEIESEVSRDGHTYKLHHNLGTPPFIDSLNQTALDDYYKWGFTLVSIWASHLSAEIDVVLDISPASLGNINIADVPTSLNKYDQFYNLLDGGDIGEGYAFNPITNQPYEKQLVRRGDYARVLAEFWADGPDSETPPGHWFVLLNTVMDDPDFNVLWKGTTEMDRFEYEVKAYFTLGGAMHDAAVSSWALKGYYDYIRPISAIRFMASRGQSSNKAKPNYDPLGIPLIDGFVELIELGDPLSGPNDEYVNEIKLYSWKGHAFISDPEVDVAGVGWILAYDWWPYQRPSFVTPPFAGYVSGHSTYSRAAAEVLTIITGSEYFPGGIGEFIALKDEFLVFEDGPSTDVKLQWAKYYDAADQCSLSRIWGGIHPPADDLPGRLIGRKIGLDAVAFTSLYFNDDIISNIDKNDVKAGICPNPTNDYFYIDRELPDRIEEIEIFNNNGSSIWVRNFSRPAKNRIEVDVSGLPPGLYFIRINNEPKGKLIIKE